MYLISVQNNIYGVFFDKPEQLWTLFGLWLKNLYFGQGVQIMKFLWTFSRKLWFAGRFSEEIQTYETYFGVYAN